MTFFNGFQPESIIKIIAWNMGFQPLIAVSLTVHEFESGLGDHVHLFVSAPPKLSPSMIIQYLKGITGRKLYMRFPELKDNLWKGQLWNHSTYIETIGDVSEDAIRRYIEHQSKQY